MSLAWCVCPREKVRINYPPQFWVKESICVNVKSKFRHGEKDQNGSSLSVLEKKYKLTTPHKKKHQNG